jgi:hypothetical protein
MMMIRAFSTPTKNWPPRSQPEGRCSLWSEVDPERIRLRVAFCKSSPATMKDEGLAGARAANPFRSLGGLAPGVPCPACVSRQAHSGSRGGGSM